jgi:hypothetical protein
MHRMDIGGLDNVDSVLMADLGVAINALNKPLWIAIKGLLSPLGSSMYDKQHLGIRKSSS